MLSLAHTVISLPFGVFLHNPILIFFLAFALHFALDAIYHWNIDPHQYPSFPVFPVSIDITAGLIIAWNVVSGDVVSLPILAAIAGSNAPDVAHTLWYSFGKPRSKRFPYITYLFDLHNRIQWETESIAKGLIPQSILVFIAILLIY